MVVEVTQREEESERGEVRLRRGEFGVESGVG
jgi:hypothetical protein